MTMLKRKTLIVLLLVGSIPFSASGGGSDGASDFPYCDVPLELPENALASEMTLSQLQVITRHGDRSPVAKIPVGTVPWVCQPFAHSLLHLNVSPQAVNRENTGPFDYPPSCANGQLTAKGRNQHLALGAAMRKKYAGRLGFLPPTLTPSNQAGFLFRSTDYPRTRQSGQAFLAGLYPAPHRIGNPVLNLRIRDLGNMQPNETLCPKITTLGAGYATSPLVTQIAESNSEAICSISKDLGTLAQGKECPTTDAGKIGLAWGTMVASDNLFARVCHDKELPEGIDFEDVTLMRDISNQMISGAYIWDQPESIELARLTGGAFLQEIRDTMRSAAREEPAPWMALYSAHDTTMWMLLPTLSQNNDVLVPYASHMAFELWRDRQGESWVAVEFNGSYLTLGGQCPESLCKLADFEATIEKFVPVDYEKECQASTTTAQH